MVRSELPKQSSHQYMVAASLQSSAFTLAAHGPITSGQEFSTRRVASKQLMAMGSGRDSATEFEYCNFEPESDNVEWSGHFPMHRGGKVVFTLAVDSSFSIALVPEAEGSATLDDSPVEPWIGIRVNRTSVDLVYSHGGTHLLQVLDSCFDDLAGYHDGQHNTYWISYDPETTTLKYGQHSVYQGNLLLKCCLEPKELEKRGLQIPKQFAEAIIALPKVIQLQSYIGCPVVECNIFEQHMLLSRTSKVGCVTVDAIPYVRDLSPRLLPSCSMTLADLDQSDVTFEANLCATGRSVASKVLQPGLTLEHEFHTNSSVPSLAQAIGYSLKTEGAFLHKLLQDKIDMCKDGTQSSSNTSLTFALAPALGNSPGAAVTLEILPVGYHGPAHDNARSYGALKVLHGELDVSIYDNDLETVDAGCSLDEVELGQGDAMWFSPTWYQTVAMACASKEYCCYILAREYGPEDEIRWPYCCYKDGRGSIQEVRPKEDGTFKEMSAAVLQELADALASDPSLLETENIDDVLARSTSMRTEAWVESETQLKPENSTVKRSGIFLRKLQKISSVRSPVLSGQNWNSISGWSYERSFAVNVPEFEEKPSNTLVTLWP